MTGSNGIVADGREREAKARFKEIRERIEKEHSEELKRAGWFRRMVIRWRMHGEIQRELERVAPGDGLYNRVETKFDSSRNDKPPTNPE